MSVQAVFLVGFMAAGKTTVGREMARRLRWAFIDLDAYIEGREQKSVREIFEEKGESGFRALEHDALRNLTESLNSDTVIALGGGTFAHLRNRELLRPFASVFLEAHPDELWERTRSDHGQRPLRSENREEFGRLYELRVGSYREATVTIVTSGKDPTSLCAEIERTLKLETKPSAGEARLEAACQKNSPSMDIGDSQ
jgi:shikimate kinase